MLMGDTVTGLLSLVLVGSSPSLCRVTGDVGGDSVVVVVGTLAGEGAARGINVEWVVTRGDTGMSLVVGLSSPLSRDELEETDGDMAGVAELVG
jgi:hypothetical protein